MISLFILSSFANSDITFQYRILPNEKERIVLTKEYLEIHRTTPLTTAEEQGLMIPRIIVVHWTANYSVKGTYNLFSNAYLWYDFWSQPQPSMATDKSRVLELQRGLNLVRRRLRISVKRRWTC